MSVSSSSRMSVILIWPKILNISSTYRASNMTGLFSTVRMIAKCSTYSRNVSATKLHIGDPIAYTLIGL